MKKPDQTDKSPPYAERAGDPPALLCQLSMEAHPIKL